MILDKQHGKSSKKWRRTGTAAVEFAVVAPIMFMVVVAMFELGRSMSIQQTLTNAAREGAREAILPTATVSSVEDVVAGYVAASLANGNTTAVTTPDPSTADPGQMITVTVTSDQTPITRYGSQWFGTQYQMSATATMRKEGLD